MHSDLLPLSRSSVDRGGIEREDPDLLGRLWSDPSTRVVLVRGGRLLVARDGDGTRLELLAPDGVARSRERLGIGDRDVDRPVRDDPDPGRLPATSSAPAHPAGLAYLGRDRQAAYLALDVPEGADPPAGDPVVDPAADDAAGPSPGEVGWTPLRDVGASLGDRDAGLAATAVALLAWHARHPRCPRCGSPTEPVHGGWARRCVVDGSLHHPRTDPAVIVAVTDGAERLLLAHSAAWPGRRYSLLAGYVEPGESLEAAVRREVEEEVALEVGDLRYAGSQPWPFPASLMLAFHGRADGEPNPDGVEITAARFVGRRELEGLLDRGELVLPTRTSVARALIEEWFGGPLPGA